MNKPISRFNLLAAGALAAALVGCGSGGGDSGGGSVTPPTPTVPVTPPTPYVPPIPPAAPATTTTLGVLGISISASAGCGFDAVNFTVNKVRVHKNALAGADDPGWTDIALNPARKINLLNLTNGVHEVLGYALLEPGRYDHLRLVLDANTGAGLANSVLPTGGVERTLEIDVSLATGIAFNGKYSPTTFERKDLPRLTVVAGQALDTVLSVDACNSVVTNGDGRYALNPLVEVIPAPLNGISGFVSPALLGSHVLVTAQKNAQVISATTPKANGEFLLSRLRPGNYDVVITADNRAASVVAAVPVITATSTTVLSTSGAPITMTASTTTASISGTARLAPPQAYRVAYVSAKQAFAPGPIAVIEPSNVVTIKSQGADLANKTYTIKNLPVAALQYAAYSATLPLVFAPSSGSAGGQYLVAAYAIDFGGSFMRPVDVSVANRSGEDFQLIFFTAP